MGGNLIMQRAITLILVISSINLTACSSFTGNVVPKVGPTMEEAYDSMPDNLSRMPHKKSFAVASPSHSISREFHKIPNAELTLYVYPHLAGKNQVPIPGYNTVLSAYEKNHYTQRLDKF